MGKMGMTQSAPPSSAQAQIGRGGQEKPATAEDVEILKRFAGELQSPALTVWVTLMERRRSSLGIPGICYEQLLKLTGLSSRSLDQALEWLEEHHLVTELQGMVERWFFAEV